MGKKEEEEEISLLAEFLCGTVVPQGTGKPFHIAALCARK